MEMLAVQGGTVITMDAERQILRGDILIANGKIAALGDVTRPIGVPTLDARGCIVLPGLVQAHTHVCQTLLRGASAPRFVLSCTDALLSAVGERVAAGARVHTHAAEQREEIELVRRERGADNLLHLGRLGLVGPRSAIAHCVHATAAERALL